MTNSRRGRSTRPGLTVGTGVAALALLIALPNVAVAAEPATEGEATPEPEAQIDPQPTKADVLAFQAAQKALSKARVRHAKAVAAHTASMKRAAKMEKRAHRAEVAARAVRRELGNMARLAYTSGNTGLNFLAGLIDARSPEDLMDRVASAERVAGHQEVEFDDAEKARTKAEQLRAEATRFFDEAVSELAAAKADLKQTKVLVKSLNLETKFNISGKPVDLGTKSEWIFPVPGAAIGSEAGMRLHPILGYTRCHAGADITAAMSTAIHAVDNGVVISAGESGGYGNYTVISHGRGLTSAYAHQSSFLVEPGDKVERGQIIGAIGSTGLSSGPHLHFEARYFGDPYNPRGWLDDVPELRVPVC